MGVPGWPQIDTGKTAIRASTPCGSVQDLADGFERNDPAEGDSTSNFGNDASTPYDGGSGECFQGWAQRTSEVDMPSTGHSNGTMKGDRKQELCDTSGDPNQIQTKIPIQTNALGNIENHEMYLTDPTVDEQLPDDNVAPPASEGIQPPVAPEDNFALVITDGLFWEWDPRPPGLFWTAPNAIATKNVGDPPDTSGVGNRVNIIEASYTDGRIPGSLGIQMKDSTQPVYISGQLELEEGEETTTKVTVFYEREFQISSRGVKNPDKIIVDEKTITIRRSRKVDIEDTKGAKSIADPNLVRTTNINVNADGFFEGDILRLGNETSYDPANPNTPYAWLFIPPITNAILTPYDSTGNIQDTPAPGVDTSTTAVNGVVRITGDVTGNISPGESFTTTLTVLDSSAELIDERTYKIDWLDVKPGESDAGIQLQMPLPGTPRVTGVWNECRDNCRRRHKGVDWAVPVGTPVYSVGDGVCVVSKIEINRRTGREGGYGPYLVIGHTTPEGVQVCTSVYGHLEQRFLKVGDQVKKGQQIAISGNRGRSQGPHLHFELAPPEKCPGPHQFNPGAKTWDPLQFLNGAMTIDMGLDASAISSNPDNPNVNVGGPSSGSETILNRTKRIIPIPSRMPAECSAPPGTDTPGPVVADDGSGLILSPDPLPGSPEPPPLTGWDPSEGFHGPAKSYLSRNCGSEGGCPANISKEEVISQVKQTLNSHPELDDADKQFFLLVASVESGYDPCAQNPSTKAFGLFQFLPKYGPIWHSRLYGGKGSICRDYSNPQKATEMAILFYKTEVQKYWNEYAARGTVLGTPRPEYAGLSKIEFCYTKIWGEGVGNAQKGLEPGNHLAVFRKKMRKRGVVV